MRLRSRGRSFSAGTISTMVTKLDESLRRWSERPLDERFRYVILDARYEKDGEEGSVRSRAVQVALGIDDEGKRHILAVEMSDKESEVSWSEFLAGLRRAVCATSSTSCRTPTMG